jgi:hypothetical protein
MNQDNVDSVGIKVAWRYVTGYFVADVTVMIPADDSWFILTRFRDFSINIFGEALTSSWGNKSHHGYCRELTRTITVATGWDELKTQVEREIAEIRYKFLCIPIGRVPEDYIIEIKV